MPDVTIKPLRSKANSIINLMGAAGGIIVLILGMVFKTGHPKNALMSYTGFFAMASGIMLVSLLIFLWKVKEPQFVAEMREESRKYDIDGKDDEAELSGNKNSAAKREPRCF